MKYIFSLLVLFTVLTSYSQSVGLRNKDDISPELLAQLVANFTNRINAEPTNGAMYHQRASVYLMQKEYDKAIADFSKSIELKSSVAAESYFFRAIVKQSKNDSTACDDFSKAKQLGYSHNTGWETIDEMCDFGK